MEAANIPTRGIKQLEVRNDIESFLESCTAAAEVAVPQGRKSASVYATYKKAANNGGYAVNVVTANGRVFLTRKDGVK